LHISGLDNFYIPKPALVEKSPPNNKSSAASPAGTGSGPNGTYMGGDFRAAYAPGVSLDGTGQSVGLLELDGYYASDITSYENTANLPNITLTNVSIDGFSGNDGVSDSIREVSLDIEMAISMATNLTKVVVYEAENTGANSVITDMLNMMATNVMARQISSSWLIGDDPNFDTAYKEFDAQGQSFFQASGDYGAYYSNSVSIIQQWADDTNITLVGATTLTTSGGLGAWASETVWNLGYQANQGAAIGSGGGINFHNIAIPSWQKGINMATNLGSTTLRNVPDVAMVGDNVEVYYNNGSTANVGGTSCAAPLWAGFTALMNQLATAQNKPAVGYLNPAIYAIGLGSNYTADFHDITTGNNTNLAVTANYYAAPGYDLCTGWGTPMGQSLINTLLSVDPLVISPTSGFGATGPAGGPFSPNSQSYSLVNSGTNSLTWSFTNNSSWLGASATGGTLAAGATNSLTVSLTSAANNLAVGSYAASVGFSNWNTHVVQGIPFSLQTLQPFSVAPTTGFNSSGLVGGPFSPASQNFVLTNSSSSPLAWSLINTSSWLSASATNATLAAYSASNVLVSLSPAATNLAGGIYAATICFTNQTSGGGQTMQFKLVVSQSLIINGGFETGDFTGWTLNLTNGYPHNFVTNSYTEIINLRYLTITPQSGSYFAALKTPGQEGYLSQDVPTAAGVCYLLSLWMENADGETPNEFTVWWNGNTLFDQDNIPKTGWTNLQYIVTATGNSTILQIGARDDTTYLELDNVSLIPILPPAFAPVSTGNNKPTFSWNATTGLVYQVESTTNLLQPNWITNAIIQATNTTINFVDTNSIAKFPRKYYRLQIMP